jgi:hypothetical protein
MKLKLLLYLSPPLSSFQYFNFQPDSPPSLTLTLTAPGSDWGLRCFVNTGKRRNYIAGFPRG